MAVTNRHRRFTIYDMMEAKGVFEANPANPDSRGEDGQALYTGPVPYPKMFYSPTGEERVTTPAEIIVTPLGPKAVGEQRELVHTLANNAQEEADLRAAGWWDHPAKSIAAAGRKAPSMGSDSRIADLESQIAQLQLERNNANAQKLADSKPTGAKPQKSPQQTAQPPGDPFSATS